jgi:Arc/MetJ-type ribon-helix-helix transcriptional regulator
MTINVSKDVESSINSAVQSGRYASADEMIAKLIQEDARRSQARADSSQESPDQWAGRLQAWVDTHPSRPITIDDSRESIYAGRGE